MPSKERALGFAEMMSSFARLSQLEEQIDIVVSKSKVPASEIRRFIRAEGEVGIKNTPLYQFLVDIFRTLDIGKLHILSWKNYEMRFDVEDCKVCDMFPDIEGQRVCYPVVDLFKRFFKEDMGLSVECEEVSCVKNGDDTCIFSVKFQPISVYPYILDDLDMNILKKAKAEELNVKTLKNVFHLSDEEAIYRLEQLYNIGFLSTGNKLTNTAISYLDYISTTGRKFTEEFDPPWKDFSVIANAVAGAVSFAQAIKEIAPDEVMPWEEEGEGVIELKEKAESSKSFAEFLSTIGAEEDYDEDEDNT